MIAIKKVFTHVRVLTFWATIAFAIYGLLHFIRVINGYSKIEMLWASFKLYMKWG